MQEYRFDPFQYRLTPVVRNTNCGLVVGDEFINLLLLPGPREAEKPKIAVAEARAIDAGHGDAKLDPRVWNVERIEDFDPGGQLPGLIIQLHFKGRDFTEVLRGGPDWAKSLRRAFLQQRKLQLTIAVNKTRVPVFLALGQRTC
jgi:hypothetical protein